MKAVIDIDNGKIHVVIEKSDKKYSKNMGGDSLILYDLKNLLNANGFNLIKKRIWKDGHMFGGETDQYIRQPNNAKKIDPHIYIYDTAGDISFLKERFIDKSDYWSPRCVKGIIKEGEKTITLAFTSSLNTEHTDMKKLKKQIKALLKKSTNILLIK